MSILIRVASRENHAKNGDEACSTVRETPVKLTPTPRFAGTKTGGAGKQGMAVAKAIVRWFGSW